MDKNIIDPEQKSLQIQQVDEQIDKLANKLKNFHSKEDMDGTSAYSVYKNVYQIKNDKIEKLKDCHSSLSDNEITKYKMALLGFVLINPSDAEEADILFKNLQYCYELKNKIQQSKTNLTYEELITLEKNHPVAAESKFPAVTKISNELKAAALPKEGLKSLLPEIDRQLYKLRDQMYDEFIKINPNFKKALIALKNNKSIDSYFQLQSSSKDTKNYVSGKDCKAEKIVMLEAKFNHLVEVRKLIKNGDPNSELKTYMQGLNPQALKKEQNKTTTIDGSYEQSNKISELKKMQYVNKGFFSKTREINEKIMNVLNTDTTPDLAVSISSKSSIPNADQTLVKDPRVEKLLERLEKAIAKESSSIESANAQLKTISGPLSAWRTKQLEEKVTIWDKKKKFCTELKAKLSNDNVDWNNVSVFIADERTNRPSTMNGVFSKTVADIARDAGILAKSELEKSKIGNIQEGNYEEKFDSQFKY